MLLLLIVLLLLFGGGFGVYRSGYGAAIDPVHVLVLFLIFFLIFGSFGWGYFGWYR